MFDFPHRRFNPLTGDWVLVSPHRARRPWLGQVEKTPPENLPSYDPDCYLCPRNERAGGIRNPDYSSTFVFDNDFSAWPLQTTHCWFPFLKADSAGWCVSRRATT